jgi:carboxyl-terminal processing protease
MSRPIRPLAAILLLGAAATGGLAREAVSNGRVFERAASLVERHYWDPTMHGIDWPATRARFEPRALAARDSRQLYAVINEMLAQLGDSHVYAISPERAEFARERLTSDEESGFGFDAVLSGEDWRIRAVQKGSPAAAAGMQIGWKLISINGEPIDIDRHFGEGDVAALVLEDENGVRHSMTLRGTPLPAEPDRRASRLPGGVLLLALDHFDEGDDRWLARQLAAAPAPTGVVLDLRENDGGEAAILDRIAGLFVAERRVVLRLFSKRNIEEKTRGAGTRSYLGPLAVLIGPRTASAGEALAAFLDEIGRAYTVGERTSGALTAGVEYRLPDGGRLSVAEYDIRTPGGRRLEGKGLTPRYPVAPTLAQLRAGEDPALQRALAMLAGKKAFATTSPPH